MQLEPRYDDVVGEVAAFLEERLAVAVAAGIPEEHVCLDPGIGFGKTPDQNLALIRGLDRICRIGPAGARRALAQEHARARARRPVERGVAGTAALGRCRGCGVRPRRCTLPRPRRRCPRGGARRGRGVERAPVDDDRAARHRPSRLPRRARGGAPGRPALPRRRRARSRARAGCAERPDRGCDRLPRGRRPRQAGLRRAVVLPPRGIRNRDRRRSRRRLASDRRAVRVRKPDVVLDPPVEYAAVRVERRSGPRPTRPGADTWPRRRATGRRPTGTRTGPAPRFGTSAASTSPASSTAPAGRCRPTRSVMLTVPFRHSPRSRSASAVRVAVTRPFLGSQTR